MKKITQIVLGLMILLSVSSIIGQSQDCNIKYNLFKGDYKAKKYDAAYDNWLWVMDSCPTLSVNIYKYGLKIAQYKLKNAADADKETCKAMVMRVFEQRMEHFPKNLAKTYDNIATFKKGQGASEDEVFKYLKMAYKADVTSMSVKNIYSYFDIILKQNKDTNPQVVFDSYDDILDGIEKKRNSYLAKRVPLQARVDAGEKLSAKDAKKLRIYNQIVNNLGIAETGLDQKLSAIATCERLIPLYKRDIEANKGNGQWLKRAVSRMYNKGCKEDPFYETLVEAYVAAAPSPDASVFYAGILLKKGNTAKAMEYYKQAVDQESDSFKKAKYLYKIAQSLRQKGQYGKARTYANRALGFNPSMGKAYLLISGMYAKSANRCGNNEFEKRMVYVAALNKARRAKVVDPSVSSAANRHIRSYASQIPTTKLIFQLGKKSGGTYRIGCWIGETVRIP